MRTLLAFLVLSSTSVAQTIDFETIPGLRGEAPEGMPIGDQYDIAPFFVRFERIDPILGAQPLALAKVGAPRTSFHGESRPDCDGVRSSDDMPNASVPFEAGCFFVTDDGLWGSSSPALQSYRVRYTVPVLQASGYVLDLDDGEEYTLHARDRNEVDVAAPVVLDRHSASPGNGGASWWFFDVPEPIHSILFEYTGHGGSKGIAFDDLSTASACPGQVIHHGNGTPGTGGRIPALSITCPQVGQPGRIDVFNGLSGAHGCLGISYDPGTRPFRCGGVLSLSPWLTRVHHLSLPGRGRGVEDGRFTLPFGPIPPAMAGLTLYIQSAYIDPGAPCGRVAFTEIVEARIR